MLLIFYRLSPQEKRSGILKELKILYVSRAFPRPYCSLLLADFETEVSKIEDPEQGGLPADDRPRTGMGEHTTEVLKAIGYSGEKIKHLKEVKTIKTTMKSEARNKFKRPKPEI